MAITILPKEEGWGETLGQSLGSGVRALAQGKVAQMSMRSNAERYKAMGLDPNLAYVPEKFGLKALGETYTRQRESAKSKEADQLATQRFGALATQGKQLGLSDSFLKTAISAGPEEGSKILTGMIRDLQKGDKKVGLLENLGVMAPSGRSPYRGATNTSVKDEMLQKYRGISPDDYAREQVNRLLNPTPEDKQRQRMEEFNLKLQEESVENPPKNQLDIINDAAAQQMMTKTLNENQPVNEYEDLLNDPNISSEDKQRLRQEMAGEQAEQEGSYGLLETPLGIAGNLASGVTQGIGALAGLPRLLENVLSPVAQMITQPIVNAEIKEWSRKADELPSGSAEQKNALRHVELLKNDQKNADLQKPSSIGFADIKENVVMPIAKAFGAEKYVTPRNVVENISDRVGKVAGGTLLSGLARGTELGVELLKSLKIPFGAETLGVLTKKFTGSDTADGVATLGGYLLGAYSPDSWNKAISSGYNNFKNVIDKVPKVQVDAAPVLEELQPILEKIQSLPGTRSNTFLQKVSNSVLNAVKNKAPGSGGDMLQQSISPHKAFELDQMLGGDTYRQASKIGGEAAGAVQQLRNGFRKIWEPYFMQNIPQATQGIIGAREAKAALNFTDKIQDRLQDLSTMKVPLFSLPGHVIKFAAKLAKPTRKFIHQMSKSDVLRDATFEAVSSAAKDDIVGLIGALNKVKSF